MRQGHDKDLYVIEGTVRGMVYGSTNWVKYLQISAVNIIQISKRQRRKETIVITVIKNDPIFQDATASSAQGPPRYRSFTITLSYTHHTRHSPSGREISTIQRLIPDNK